MTRPNLHVVTYVLSEKEYWKSTCRLHGYSDVDKYVLEVGSQSQSQSHHGTSEAIIDLSSNSLDISLLCNSDRAANS